MLADFRQVTDNHVRATVELADEVDAGERGAPGLRALAGELHGRRPVPRRETRTGIETAVAAIGVPILVGAMVDAGPGHVMNQGIVWDPVLGGGDRYTKRHPVPFGEYIPWRNVFGDSFGKLDMIPRDMLSGTREEPLRVGDALVADAICFDVAYDDGLYDQVTHGAQMVVVQTSNAMFIHTSQIEQQFEISRVRAIELGRSLAVASVNGAPASSGRTARSWPPPTRTDHGRPRRRGHPRLLDHPRHPRRALGRGLSGPLTVLAVAVALLVYRRPARGAQEDVPEHRDLAPAPDDRPLTNRTHP